MRLFSSIISALSFVVIGNVFAQTFRESPRVFNGPHQIEKQYQLLGMAIARRSHESLSSFEQELVAKSLSTALATLNRAPGYPQPNPNPNPYPIPTPHTTTPNPNWRYNQKHERNKIVVFSDSYCSNVITEIRAYDSCDRFNGIFRNLYVGSVSINGLCVNTPDKSFQAQCPSLIELASSQSPRSNDLVLYSDSYCSNSMTTIDPGVNCNGLGGVLSGLYIGSVNFSGVCVNIQDVGFSAEKCSGLQNAVLTQYENNGERRRGDSVALFTDSYCSNALTTIKPLDNCHALGNIFQNMYVGSVKFRNNCINIHDDSFANVCGTYSK